MGNRSAPGIVSPGFFTVERVLILLTVLAALAGILIKDYCRSNGWETPGQFYATCYSDFPELFRNRGLGGGAFPFITQGSFFEYPVLMGFIAGATALLVPGGGAGAPRVLAYYDVNATLIAAVWIVTVLATARMTRRRPWDAAMVALAPGIVLAGIINWDMWAVGLLAVGMYFFVQEQAGPCRHLHRPGHRHQAVPPADPRRHPAAGPAHREASGPSWSPPAPPPRPGSPSTSRLPRTTRPAGNTSTSSPRTGRPATARPGSPTTWWPGACGWTLAARRGHQRPGPESLPAGLRPDRGAGPHGTRGGPGSRSWRS